jgi:hypothetical protein
MTLFLRFGPILTQLLAAQMMILGFGGVGFMAHRRRKTAFA